MDKNKFIGFTLIMGILFIWLKINAPTEAEIAIQKHTQDSLAMVEHVQDSLANISKDVAPTTTPSSTLESVPDSVRQLQNVAKYGGFSAAANGENKDVVLENDKMKIIFSSKGAKIKEVVLKEYSKIVEDSNHVDIKSPLVLLEDEKNKFNYAIPVSNATSGFVNSEDLYFTPSLNGNTVVFTAKTNSGGSFEQIYSIGDDYGMDYDIRLNNMNNVMSQGTPLKLQWINYLDKIEKNPTYEAMYSTIVFKEKEGSTDNCSYRGNDDEKVETALKWVSTANQFFNTSLIADEAFGPASMDIKTMDKDSKDLKETIVNIDVPISNPASSTFGMKMYIGPNEFDGLKAFEADLDDVVPYGWSIFGTINRWVIRPVYRFIHGLIGNVGIAILLLTLLVKLVVYPLTYKMLYSQSKMAALKPRLAKLKEKYGDDSQTIQMETMKLYREYGVNPLGGCMPMLIQMPVWYALFRFFPASIDFRQASFLWATDLSSYDVAWRLPFTIPMYGDHVSLFTILWALTTVIYTYYNSKHMDMSANPAMKYMQYMMPIMFLVFFNSYAAGLTIYMFFSNVLNITQTIVTKNFIIDNEKIERELNAYKAKPKKKKSGFSAKLQEAMEQQKKLAEEAKKNKKK